MKTIESIMFFTFLVSYSYVALRSIFWPEVARVNEIRFFSSPGLDPSDIIPHGLAAISAIAMVAHLTLEGFVAGQIVLYVNVILFIIFSLAHWTHTYRTKMLERVRATRPSGYQAAGIRKLALIVIMVALPITL